MPITFFQLLNPVIERDINFVANQLGITESDVYERILEEAERNQREWYSNNVPNLNYQLQECRLAYLYIVAAANANVFKHVIENNEDLNTYILSLAQQNNELKVCALGGGPGTELMGLSKFFDRQQLGSCVHIDFQLLDKVQEWANSWYGIRNAINNAFRTEYGTNRSMWPVSASGNFIACDVTETNFLHNLGNIWGQDIYIINFLLSEVFNDDPGLRDFLREISNVAPQGARFVFIERRGSMWAERIHNIARESNLELSRFFESRENKDNDELPEDLGDAFLNLSQRRVPRLSWNVTYSIGIKQ